MPVPLPCFVKPGAENPKGQRLFQLLLDECGMRPDSRVLEVGCGSGRVAMVLAAYLTRQYVGFDVHAAAIEHCRASIEPLNPCFSFYWADVRNERYQNYSQRRAAEYTFPHGDATFDVVYASSVFTHMLSCDTERYFAEIRRVLAPGGAFLSTWFILNAQSLYNMRLGLCRHVFRKADGCWIKNPANPEQAVAYEEERLKKLYAASGFRVQTWWTDGWGHTRDGSQDYVVARPAP